MIKATVEHTRVRHDRHPSTQKSERDSIAAPADHVLVLAESIEAKEREQECASRNGDQKLGRLLDGELSALDDQLAFTVPTSWEGAAFKLRKCAHFAENSTIAEQVRKIADRVSRGRIELQSLLYLQSVAAYLSREGNDAAPPFITTALQWFNQLKMVGCTARRA